MRSHAASGPRACKISASPANDQYASAFSPPNVSWRRFARCVSAGSAQSRAAADGRAAGAADVVGDGVAGVAQAATDRSSVGAQRRMWRSIPALPPTLSRARVTRERLALTPPSPASGRGRRASPAR